MDSYSNFGKSDCSPLKLMSAKLVTLLSEEEKTFVKVGWRDTCLNLTEKGKQAILNRYLDKNKQAFFEMAKELLEED